MDFDFNCGARWDPIFDPQVVGDIEGVVTPTILGVLKLKNIIFEMITLVHLCVMWVIIIFFLLMLKQF